MEIRQQNLPLRTQIFSIVLIPTLVVSVCLAAYFLLTRVNDLDEQYQERGESLLLKYAPITQHALKLPQSENTLNLIAQAILNEPSVRAASIYDHNSSLIIHAGPSMFPIESDKRQKYQLPLTLSPSPQRFVAPIGRDLLSLIHLSPSRSEGSLERPENQPFAWLEIELSPTPQLLKKYQSLVNTTAFILLCLALTGYFALRVSAFITSPLEKITHAIARIKEGQLSTRVKAKASGELEMLASGINSMTESLQSAREEMQNSIDQATEDLRSTLETIEIQNIELDMARKEAVEASRVKSEFLANMSHEIRTPLNGIIGFTNLLLKSQIDSRQSDYLVTIQKSSESLLAIINDILDFSKIEAGKLSLDQTPVNIRETLEEVLSMLAPMAQDKCLEQALLIYSDVPKTILGDPLRIKQVVTNLVNNAVKFSENNAIIVRAMLEDEKKGKSILKISVSDAGIGLSEEAQKHLFQAFHQSDSSNIRRFQGTGLGLAISRHLVEMMGGEIGVESYLGDGSTFWFTIRADIDERQGEQLRLQPLSHLNVAIYDSNPTVCLGTLHLLNEWAIETTQFTLIDDLINHVENDDKTHFDIAIIGLDFDDIKNKNLLNTISICNKSSDTKFLLLANSAHLSGPSFLEQYADCILQKPTPSARLHQAIADLSETKIKNSYKEISAPQKKPVALAVDDNPANLKLIAALLDDLDIEVDACESAEKAISLFKKNQYGLIFMDIQMPIMDGVEATQVIREIEPSNRKRTPIIALTAHAMASEKVQLLRSGMDDYLTKPITTSQLQHAIHKWTGFQFHDTHFQASSDTPFKTKFDRVTPASAGNIIDMNQGLKLAGGKQDLANEMLEMLITHISEDQTLITNAFKNKNYIDLLERVHYLHGATRYCGVPLLREASHHLEDAIKKEKSDQYESRVSELTRQMDDVVSAYKKLNVISSKETS